jgi:hypothetical protein
MCVCVCVWCVCVCLYTLYIYTYIYIPGFVAVAAASGGVCECVCVLYMYTYIYIQGSAVAAALSLMCVKRDLLQCQKRPTIVSKETYYSSVAAALSLSVCVLSICKHTYIYITGFVAVAAATGGESSSISVMVHGKEVIQHFDTHTHTHTHTHIIHSLASYTVGLLSLASGKYHFFFCSLFYTRT